ncbi:MAG: homoserine O-acetyltransferase [Chlorobi bacterium OLB7]|nr:MAG: homoserine O-acetyltransferase [Chlorobi bacterium OLB7]
MFFCCHGSSSRYFWKGERHTAALFSQLPPTRFPPATAEVEAGVFVFGSLRSPSLLRFLMSFLQRLSGVIMSAVPHHVSAIATLPAPFVLESGAVLPELHLAYESYGKLSPNRDNVILVCHALTGSAAAGVGPNGRAGWWAGLIGPGNALDTRRHHIICSNIIGSCYGSTGPGSINSRKRGFRTATVSRHSPSAIWCGRNGCC